MPYAILRIEKHSGASANKSLGGMTKHNKREIEVPNADPEMKHLNKELVGTGDYLLDAEKRIKESKAMLQKNGVKAIEHLMTASPDFFDKHKDWDRERAAKEFSLRAFRFLKATYGEENITSFSLHMDEKTPHIHAFVTPIVKGKLKGGKEVNRVSARNYINGAKKLREMQTSFASYFEDLELDRGKEKSKAKHTTIQNYYSALNRADEFQGEFQVKVPQIEGKPPRLGNLDEWTNNENQKIRQQMVLELKRIKEWVQNKSFLSASEVIESGKYENFKDDAEQVVTSLESEIEQMQKEFLKQNKMLHDQVRSARQETESHKASYRTQKEKAERMEKKARHFLSLASQLHTNPGKVPYEEIKSLEAYIQSQKERGRER
jgi:hypothetical protein